jgi:phosphoribosylglycinamide formyltransferase-1
MNKINLAVFASTRGTDLQAIIDAKNEGSLEHVNIRLVLSNKADCFALERAGNAGIKTVFVDPKGKNRLEFDAECLRICEENEINLIYLIGYMRIISGVLISAYQGKILNIHPSLLPKYPGMDLDVHAEVIRNGETETGCTLHFVTEDLDAGPIFLQEKVELSKDETPESLKEKVQELEKKLVVKGLVFLSEN